MSSIFCGKCRQYHSSVDEVKACFNKPAAVVSTPMPANVNIAELVSDITSAVLSAVMGQQTLSGVAAPTPQNNTAEHRTNFPDMEYFVKVVDVTAQQARTGNWQIVIHYELLGTLDLGRYAGRKFRHYRNLQPAALKILASEYKIITGADLPAMGRRKVETYANMLKKVMLNKVIIARLYEGEKSIESRYTRKASEVELAHLATLNTVTVS